MFEDMKYIPDEHIFVIKIFTEMWHPLRISGQSIFHVKRFLKDWHPEFPFQKAIIYKKEDGSWNERETILWEVMYS